MHVPQDSLSLLPCCEHPLLPTCCPLPATCTRDTFLAQDAALCGQKQGRAPLVLLHPAFWGLLVCSRGWGHRVWGSQRAQVWWGNLQGAGLCTSSALSFLSSV